MSRHKILLTIDENLYYGLKELPRDVSVSDIVSVLLQSMLEEVKRGKKMSQKELDKWVNSDEYRKEVRLYMQEKLGPYVDYVDDKIQSLKLKK